MQWRSGILWITCLLLFGGTVTGQDPINKDSSVQLVILGTVQDAGSPQINCKKECCADLWKNPDESRMVVSIGLIDHQDSLLLLVDATPDIGAQWEKLQESAGFQRTAPDGIFLTHAHIGHYTGLMYLGKEAMNSPEVPVYAMPRMKGFLETNGPWSQLVSDKNILLKGLKEDRTETLNSNISVTPFTVPHRDEYSETVGYTIEGPNKKALFIPDIDKWSKWNKDIVEAIAGVDFAFLDGTFFDVGEIPGRDISEIPHPFISESLRLFDRLSSEEKDKIHFIHFNHTNPVLNAKSEQYKEVLKRGYHIALTGDIFEL